jgi:hypothetical protein
MIKNKVCFKTIILIILSKLMIIKMGLMIIKMGLMIIKMKLILKYILANLLKILQHYL